MFVSRSCLDARVTEASYIRTTRGISAVRGCFCNSFTYRQHHQEQSSHQEAKQHVIKPGAARAGACIQHANDLGTEKSTERCDGVDQPNGCRRGTAAEREAG